MSVKMKDPKTGKEVEYFTADEVQQNVNTAVEAKKKESDTALEAARTEAIEQYKKDHPDQKGEIDKLQADLLEAQSELDTLKDGGEDDKKINEGQKTRLLKKISDMEKLIQETTKTSNEAIQNLQSQISKDYKADMIKRLSAGDAELAKKIEFEFDNYMPTKTDKASMGERMTKAYALATGNKPQPNLLDGAASGSEAGNHQTPAPTKAGKEASENEKAVGVAVGVTDADREKYSGVSAANPTAKVS